MNTALGGGEPVMFADRTAYDAAVTTALAVAAAYFNSGTPTMPDADFDTLFDRIAATKRMHTDWDDRGLLTQVAAGTSPGGDVEHPAPMLSLDKITSSADITKFLSTLGDSAAVAELKFDGMAVRAVYRAGVLVLAATRGDGARGDNITAQAVRHGGLAGLPPVLDVAWSGEVIGEAFLTTADFTRANINRTSTGRDPFATPRNAAAGALRKSDLTYRVPMSFAAYDATGAGLDTIDSHLERMASLEAIGIRTAAARTIEAIAPHVPDRVVRLSDPTTVIESVGHHRAALAYPLDGVVLKSDSHAARARMGSGTRAPEWAVAYKYAPTTGVQSVLRAIEIGVGRTGRATFRAAIDPVVVDGVTITYATLHHAQWIRDQGLGIGSAVIVTRANDVIPRVEAAADHTPGVTPWNPPTTCPQCGQEWDTTSQLWRCVTPACSLASLITYAASRDVWDIQGLGSEIAGGLVEADLIASVADLFTLTVADVAATPLNAGGNGESRTIGETTARRIVDGIAAAKNHPLNRHITALGIPMTGRSVGRWLAQHFGSLEALRAATVDQLAALDKIGPSKAAAIHRGLHDNRHVIDQLIAAGVTTRTEPAGATTAGPLAGKTVVVTGTVPGLNRSAAQEAAIRMGATVSSSVSTRTDLLVIGAGAENSSKHSRAQQLGVTVMPAVEFVELHQQFLAR